MEGTLALSGGGVHLNLSPHGGTACSQDPAHDDTMHMICTRVLVVMSNLVEGSMISIDQTTYRLSTAWGYAVRGVHGRWAR